MFNETSYQAYSSHLGATPECAAIKLNCDTRFPPSTDPDVMAGIKPDLNWDCMKASGYVSKCMETSSYAEPGSTTYGIDILTNPQNPNTVWQWPQFAKDFADKLGLDPSTLAMGAGVLVLALFMFKGR